MVSLIHLALKNGYFFDVSKITLLFSVSLTYMESRLGGACIKEEDDPEDMRGDHYFSPVYPYYIWTD